MLFLPEPQSVVYTGGSFLTPETWRVCVPEGLEELKAALVDLWPELAISPAAGEIAFINRKGLAREAYCLSVEENGVKIEYGEAAGAFYAVTTLYQMALQCGGAIPCCRIEDWPVLQIRGALLDISRGKVPKPETLKAMVCLLASMKLNHLELYIEGFSFAYPSFPEVWKETGCLTPEELKDLSAFCRQHFIELVPHQNSLGHMAPWLAREEFRNLAEAPEGLHLIGRTFPPTTLNAAEPGSLALVENMMEDLLPAFASEWFHVGLDEAFEFGKGRNQAFVSQYGGEALILPYVMQLHDFLASKGKKMILWDDFVIRYPDLVRRFPEDLLIFDWGYDAEYPVEKRAELLMEAGVKFCLCPGTSSWSSFTGLTDNMLENIRRTAEAAYCYHASGLVVTDWGDMNHLQYQPVSYAGMLYAAAWSWNKKGISETGLAEALDRFVFRDAAGRMGKLCLEAGRFYLQEEFRMPCRSLACLPLIFRERKTEDFHQCVKQLVESVTFFSPEEVCEAYLSSYENRKTFDGDAMYGFLAARMAELETVRPACRDGELIVREYRNALNMLWYLTKQREAIETGQSVEFREGFPEELIEEHCFLWRQRNKESGLAQGAGMLAAGLSPRD